MKHSLLEILACPRCCSKLALSGGQEAQGEIESGSLNCAACPSAFPIRAFIPRFVPEDNYAASFGFEWNRFRQTQLDSRTGTTISRDRFLRETGWAPDALRGSRVLDAGCGAGRFAEVALSLGADLVAIDYSGAVDACRQNFGAHPGLNLVQADIYALPFAEGKFDFVYSLGVLQNLPDPRKAVSVLPAQLKPGGRLAVDVYRRDWKTWAHPRHVLRLFSTRLSHEELLHRIEKAAPSLLRLSNLAGRVPLLGRGLQRLVPIANYEGVLPLNQQQLHEFAVLDTFDWLSPVYDQPQRDRDMRQWLLEAGLEDVEVLHLLLLVGRGRKKGTQPCA